MTKNIHKVLFEFHYSDLKVSKSISVDTALIPNRSVNYCVPMSELSDDAFLDIEFHQTGHIGNIVINAALVIDGVVKPLHSHGYSLNITYSTLGGRHYPKLLNSIPNVRSIYPEPIKNNKPVNYNRFIPSPDQGYGRARK